MVGLVIVTHGELGRVMLETAQAIVQKPLPDVPVVSVDWRAPVPEIQETIRAAIRKVRDAEGVIIVTDMFGGTPSNISLSFIDEGPIVVLTGLNLPMLVVYFNYRDRMDYQTLARHMKKRAIESIVCSLDLVPEIHSMQVGKRP